jgi:hypothetical protein
LTVLAAGFRVRAGLRLLDEELPDFEDELRDEREVDRTGHGGDRLRSRKSEAASEVQSSRDRLAGTGKIATGDDWRASAGLRPNALLGGFAGRRVAPSRGDLWKRPVRSSVLLERKAECPELAAPFTRAAGRRAVDQELMTTGFVDGAIGGHAEHDCNLPADSEKIAMNPIRIAKMLRHLARSKPDSAVGNER